MDLLVESAHGGEDEQQVGLNRTATWAERWSLSPNLISLTATVSFSLTTGSIPGCEQGLQRVPGIEIAFPVVHVVPGQKDLRRVPSVPREESLVEGHEEVLTDGGTGLQLRDGLGRTGQTHDRSPGRHRPDVTSTS